MNFTLNRDLLINSALGHAVDFKKDISTFVPPVLWKEVMDLGAVPDDDLPIPEFTADRKTPSNPQDRYNSIKEAIEHLTLKNSRGDFNAGGTPHLSAIANRMGWAIDAKERDAAITRMKSADADEPVAQVVDTGEEVVVLQSIPPESNSVAVPDKK